jgi:hypothetical protein
MEGVGRQTMSRDSSESFKPLTRHRDEERYFYEQDLELVRRLRERVTLARREREEVESKKQHWMRCPKCGGSMEELHFDVLLLDRCMSCHGVFLDEAELSLLRELEIEGKRGAGDFLARLISDLAQR